MTNKEKRVWVYKHREAPLKVRSKHAERIRLRDEKTGVEWHYSPDSWADRSIPGVVENSCYEWKGSWNQNGMGMFPIKRFNDEAKTGMINAPRLAMAIRLGRPLRKTEFVYSQCQNPECTNPKHLTIGTKQDAIRNGKGREKWSDEWLDAHLETLLYSTQGEVVLALGLTKNQASNCKTKAKKYMERLERGLVNLKKENK
jgi:hypothetical protein